MSTKPTVLVTTSSFPKVAIDLLKTRCDVYVNPQNQFSRQQLMDEISGKDAVVIVPGDKIDRELLNSSNLKCVSTWSVGFDHIDIDFCKKKNVIVCHTRDVLTNTVAELAIALLLACARRVVEATNTIRQGKWVQNYDYGFMFGVDVQESVVGIFGFGRIGQAVARKLIPFEPKKIIYYDIVNQSEADSLLAEKVEFPELLAESDFLIVCTTLTAQTQHIFDARCFQQMKNNAIFINISRGQVVDQAALTSALQNNQIRAAGLDVMIEEPMRKDDPLLKLDNCVLTPHIGTATFTCREKMGLMAVQNVIDFFDGKSVKGKLC